MDLSVVIPVCNEEESIGTLINEITHALDGKYQHEIIVIDDGSTDNTLEVLLKTKQDKNLNEKTYLERSLVRDCILIGANTMLRVGELWQLKWKDIKSINEAKTNKGLKVEIVELEVRAETSKIRVSRIVKARGGEYFKRLRHRSNYTGRDDFVFCQIDSPVQFRRESFYRDWQILMEGANIKDHKERKLTWYSLRHYGITTRLRAEIDIATLADIAGTSIDQIEKHYGHIDSSMRDRAILKDPIYMPIGTEESTWE